MKKPAYATPRKKLSWLAVAFTLITLGYILYRGFSVLGPNGAGSFLHTQAATISLACANNDETKQPTTDMHEVSAEYQKFIAQQPAIGPNLVANANLQSVNKNTESPLLFFRTQEDPTLAYSMRKDLQGNYLHLEHTRPGQSNGAWVADMIPLLPAVTYSYSAAYRSTTPVVVTAELVDAAGHHSYKAITQLAAANEWQPFTSYFHNDNSKAFRFILSPASEGSIDTRSYGVHAIAGAELTRGIVSVTFDDGWQSIADKALPLLEKNNIRTTQYIITEALEKHIPGYMDYRSIKNLQKQGNEIGSHSIAHCDQTKLSPGEIQRNAEQSKALLQKNFGTVSSFAYPYGSYDQNTQAVFAKSFPLIRTSDIGYNDRYFDPQNIRSFAVTSHTTDKDFQNWLAYAREHKSWLVIVYHRIDEQGEYNVTSAHLAQQLQMISDSRLDILPLAEAAHHIRP